MHLLGGLERFVVGQHTHTQKRHSIIFHQTGERTARVNPHAAPRLSCAHTLMRSMLYGINIDCNHLQSCITNSLRARRPRTHITSRRPAAARQYITMPRAPRARALVLRFQRARRACVTAHLNDDIAVMMMCDADGGGGCVRAWFCAQVRAERPRVGHVTKRFAEILRARVRTNEQNMRACLRARARVRSLSIVRPDCRRPRRCRLFRVRAMLAVGVGASVHANSISISVGISGRIHSTAIVCSRCICAHARATNVECVAI